MDLLKWIYFYLILILLAMLPPGLGNRQHVVANIGYLMTHTRGKNSSYIHCTKAIEKERLKKLSNLPKNAL